jgi:lysophospholipase L1-like esterase
MNRWTARVGHWCDPPSLVSILVTLASTFGCSEGFASNDGSDMSTAGASSTRPLNQGPFRIAVLGSSTAAGYAASSGEASWVGLFTAHVDERFPGSQVSNLAISEYTTYHILPSGTPPPPDRPDVDSSANVTAALDWGAEAIIINMPSNDAAGSLAVEETMQNLHTIADEAAVQGVNVWVATSQPRQLSEPQIGLLTGVRDQTLAEFGDHAIDFWSPLVARGDDSESQLRSEYDSGDGTHLNDAGHEVLFRQVVDSTLLPTLQMR